jgi:caa(3)-type oxidase subunit IV
MSHKIIPVKYYLYNAGFLTFLMALTVLFAKRPELHFSDNPNGINLAIALAIAIAKAACIVAIFMGSYWQSGLVRILSVAGFAWLCIFFMFIATDYGNPLEEFGTPYLDGAQPGANPRVGGQDHPVTGFEHTPAHGGNYVAPPHLFGHGETQVEDGATKGHGAAPESGTTPVSEHH